MKGFFTLMCDRRVQMAGRPMCCMGESKPGKGLPCSLRVVILQAKASMLFRVDVVQLRSAGRNASSAMIIFIAR